MSPVIERDAPRLVGGTWGPVREQPAPEYRFLRDLVELLRAAIKNVRPA